MWTTTDSDSDIGGGEAGEEESVAKNLSRHEKEQMEIKKKIAQLEEFNLSEKPWQLAGGE